MRLSSSSSVCDSSSSQNFMATKLQNQSNRSVRVPSAVSLTGKRFLTDLRHHHASSFTGKTVTKLPRACPRVTMKNLCLRRVFTPSSISSDWDFHVKGENQTKEVTVESPFDSQNSNVTREGNKDLVGGLLATGDDLETVEFSQTTMLPNTEMFTIEPSFVKNEAGTKLRNKVIRHPEKVFKNFGSVSYRRLLPYLMEAADVTSDVDMKDLKNERVELMAGKDRLLETRPVLHGNSSPFKKMTSSNATKISLCSRKLFKVPGSVNYRRMLSFLKENSEDNPGTPNHIDLQKHMEENASATENKGASFEAMVSNTCSNNVEAPL